MATYSRIGQEAISMPVRAAAFKNRLLVAAIDFGTTFSGYAFQFRADFELDPLKITASNWKSSTSYISHKTPTCILFDKDQQFHSFGTEAETKYNEIAADNETWNWYYFKHFKMFLYRFETLSRTMTLRDDKGLEMPAMIVFAASVKYLKDHMIESCNNANTGVRPGDIHWVLTVPAIWPDSAKQFMREAAINAEIHTDMLSLSLEPEAASLFCRNIPIERVAGVDQADIRCFRIGDKYMILDAGGGTVDITVHEIQPDSTLKELAKANGGEYGGTMVDKKFIELLDDIFGPDVMEVIQQRYRDDYLDVLQSFEITKRRVKPDLSGVESFQIPLSFRHTYKEINKIELATGTIKPDYLKNMITFNRTKDQMRVDAEIVKSLFTEVCAQICAVTAEFLQSIKKHNVEKIMMVGGFSESQMLQNKVRNTFPQTRLIIPEEAGLAVLKGAVIFGHNPMMITARVCKYSYGIRAYKHFESGIDPPEKREVNNNIVLCKDYFSKHATVGQEYQTEEKVYTQEYVPSDVNGSELEIWIYTSPKRNPMYIDEDGCKKIGEMRVKLHDSQGIDNPVAIQFEFGKEELQIMVKETKTGKITNANFDLL